MTKRGMSPQKAEEIRVSKGLDKGSKLRILRVKRGLSQSELAEKSNVPVRTLQKYENNWSPIDGAKLDTMCQLSLALDCKITDILESDELIEKLNKAK